ncbi:MAG: hypothetical protein L6R39_002329 [Caloplaca ligustica]|nr:MAG: hypothetical protein L6R39_002329 [Caloplaca ligustica]
MSTPKSNVHVQVYTTVPPGSTRQRVHDSESTPTATTSPAIMGLKYKKDFVPKGEKGISVLQRLDNSSARSSAKNGASPISGTRRRTRSRGIHEHGTI